MAIYILPDAQEDLLSLQEYMLDKWSEADWLKAEDAIFEKLALVDTGFLTGAPVQELSSVGIFEYQNVFTLPHGTSWSIGVSATTLSHMPWRDIGRITQHS
jgi:hypothetical protein